MDQRVIGALPTRLGVLAIVAGVSFGATTISAHADNGAPPVVTKVSPTTIVPDGHAIKVTVSGTGLAAVDAVFAIPVVSNRSFQAFNDTTLLVTLPSDLAAGTYSIRVSSPFGTSDPGAAAVTVAAVPPPSKLNLDTLPAVPRPTFVAPPATGGEPPTVTQSQTARAVAAERPRAPTGSGFSAAWIVVLGLLAGGLAYALWGSAGRLSMARRQSLLAQAVARPAQRFHLGRICVQCGRLHWVWRTRRDLWKSGEYCSATCFVSGQEAELSHNAGEEVASSRLREVVVYNDLEKALSDVFETAEALFSADDILRAADAAAAITGPSTNGKHPPLLAAEEDPVEGQPLDPGLDVLWVSAWRGAAT